MGLTKEDEFDVGKTFNGRNSKNMSLILVITDPLEILDKKIVASRRIPI